MIVVGRADSLFLRGCIKYRSFCLAASQRVMEQVADVSIDPAGTFKYILIRITGRKDEGEKRIVRGYGECEFHADILDKVAPALKARFKLHVEGGGRIKHDPQSKKLLVYGYSLGFGRGDHAKAVEILKRHYGDYEISWKNEGY